MDRGVEAADARLQAHRAGDQLLQLRRQFFDGSTARGSGGGKLDLGFLAIGLVASFRFLTARCMSSQDAICISRVVRRCFRSR